MEKILSQNYIHRYQAYILCCIPAPPRSEKGVFFAPRQAEKRKTKKKRDGKTHYLILTLVLVFLYENLYFFSFFFVPFPGFLQENLPPGKEN